MLQPSPIYARFQRAAKNQPDKTALIVGAHAIRYRELQADVSLMSRQLSALGIRSGDHLGVVLPNCTAFVTLLLAAARLGAVIVPQSPGLPCEAITATFAAADVEHQVIWHGLASSFQPGSGINVSVGGPTAGWISDSQLLQPLSEEGADIGSAVFSEPELPADHPYLLVLTSGSTGKPKPIVLSQDTKVARAQAAAALYGVSAADVTLAATPIYHSLAQRLVLMPLMSGGTCIVMEHFQPDRWIEAIDRHGVSFTIAVSSQLKSVLARSTPSDPRLRSLRCLVSSSALLDNATKRDLAERLDCAIHECYGASEIAIATNLDATARDKLGSVGKAIPEVDVRILGEDGKLAAPGIPGEILCRTPMRYSGYYLQPQTTAAADWQGYFRTGDLGRLDADGYLWFLGRIKDIIITGGVNVYPKDIEDAILRHPAVAECAAIAIPDRELGEVVAAVIAFKENAPAAEIRSIQRLCMAQLGDFQQPRDYFVVDGLPKNAMGKIDKPALRARYAATRQTG